MVHIFISHSSSDAQLAARLVDELERHGVKCWIAPRDVLPGDDFRNAILQAIETSVALILLFSASAATSEHVAREVSLAEDKKLPIYPIRLSKADITGPLKYSLQGRQWIEFKGEGQAAVADLALILGASVNAQRIRPLRMSPSRQRLIATGVGVAAIVTLSACILLGSMLLRAQQTIDACDLAAGSELELEPRAGNGAIPGLVNIESALAACRTATAEHPYSARMAYNLAWLEYANMDVDGLLSMFLGSHPDSPLAPMIKAAKLGHIEAGLFVWRMAGQKDALASVGQTHAFADRMIGIARKYNASPKELVLLAKTVSEPGHLAQQSGAWVRLMMVVTTDDDWHRAVERALTGVSQDNPALRQLVLDGGNSSAAAFFDRAKAATTNAGDEQILRELRYLISSRLMATASSQLFPLAMLDVAAIKHRLESDEVVDRIEPRTPKQLLEAAANGGDPRAMLELARLLYDDGSSKFDLTAYGWLRRAADSGYRPAVVELARAYLRGDDVLQSIPKAVELMGRIGAPTNIGVL